MQRRGWVLAAGVAVAGALTVPAAAHAHVTLQPEEVAAKAFVVLDVRVPNEEENASTTKVAVRFPAGFAEVRFQPVPGWTVRVKKSKLAKPVTTDEGDQITEQVSQVTWSGGEIGPGEFQDFPVSVQVPDKAGSALTFKALQTYDDGNVARWIGAPDSDEPAPQVKVTAAAEENAAAGTAAATPAASTESSDDGGSDALAIIALIVGALGLLAGGAALLLRRRV